MNIIIYNNLIRYLNLSFQNIFIFFSLMLIITYGECKFLAEHETASESLSLLCLAGEPDMKLNSYRE